MGLFHWHDRRLTTGELAILRVLQGQQKLLEEIMANVAQMQAEVAAINEATNEIAADIDGLKARIEELLAGGGLTGPDSDAVLAELVAISERLRGIAAGQ